MKPFNVLEHPIVFGRPKLTPPYSWVGHIPFAYLAVSLIRPRKLVELGTHSGNSYLAFCQAVLDADTSTECFAVDTWEGDDHATQYGSGVYAALHSYHAPRYSEFSTLLRKTFDDALSDFDDQEIDLLHIDGLHTYEAVKHDFETWLPKLSGSAVVLMHDTEVRDGDFGVWRYFEELSRDYRTFSFGHSNGLGVVCVGGEIPENFRAFLDAADAAPDAMRKFFEGIASTLVDARTGLANPLSATGGLRLPLTAKLFYRSCEDTFSESKCAVASVGSTDGRLRLVFDVTSEANLSFLRMDPADCPGVYGVCGIRLVSATGEVTNVRDFPRRIRSIVGEEVPAELPAYVRFVSLSSDPSIEFDLSDLMQEESDFVPKRVEVDVVYFSVLSDEESAYLAGVLDDATLEARASARTLDHVVNLLSEHANVGLGLVNSVVGLEGGVADNSRALSHAGEVLRRLDGRFAELQFACTGTKEAVDEVASAISSSVDRRQAEMELEINLANDALQEQIEGLHSYVDSLRAVIRDVGKSADQLVPRISQAESSLVAHMEVNSRTAERTWNAVESQMAVLSRMAAEQERTSEFLQAVHTKLDRRNPLYWMRRFFGRRN